MQITKELPNGIILFVQVPDDGNPSTTGITAKNPLPDGNWELLGDSKSLTEEQLKEIMPILWNGFVNFLEKDKPVGNYKRYVVKTSLESYNSLKESLGVVDVNPLPKPEALFDEYGNGGYCETWVRDYEDAQQQVKSYQVLYKKN